jgi:hypothetical protein
LIFSTCSDAKTATVESTPPERPRTTYLVISPLILLPFPHESTIVWNFEELSCDFTKVFQSIFDPSEKTSDGIVWASTSTCYSWHVLPILLHWLALLYLTHPTCCFQNPFKENFIFMEALLTFTIYFWIRCCRHH